MRWFVTLLSLCTTLFVWHAASAAGPWNPAQAAAAPMPAPPWVLTQSLEWLPPPPTARESTEVEVLRDQLEGLWAALAERDVTVEQLRRRLFATLQHRDHWWSQLRWVWEQARRDHNLAWRRIGELETALAQAHHGGAVMAEQLAGFRRRVQTTLGELAERESRIQAMERQQADLRAALDQRTVELDAARGSLQMMLAENTRLRADADRLRSRQLGVDEPIPPRREVAHAETAAVEIAAFETEPAWARQEFEELKKSLHDELVRLVDGREGSLARATADDLHAIRVDRGYLESRLKEVLAEREALEGSLSSARLALQQAMAEAGARSAELASLREQAATLRERLEGTGERLDLLVSQRGRDQERISALEAENARLMQRLLAAETLPPEARIDAGAEGDMAELGQAIAALEKELSLARAELVPLAGRDADPQNLQVRAAKLADAYKVVYTVAETQVPAETEVRTGLERLSDDLFMEQSLLARAVAASGVYKVLPHDSLSRISYKVYGTGRRWPDIYAANDHLLSNPDSLLPGLVLVIP